MVLVLGCSPRHKESVSTEQVLPVDYLFKGLVCSCISTKMERYGFDAGKDGSVQGYINIGDFGMAEFHYLSEKVIEEYEKNPPKSFNDHTLELLGCIKTVEDVLRRYRKGEYVIPEDYH